MSTGSTCKEYKALRTSVKEKEYLVKCIKPQNRMRGLEYLKIPSDTDQILWSGGGCLFHHYWPSMLGLVAWWPLTSLEQQSSSEDLPTIDTFFRLVPQRHIADNEPHIETGNPSTTCIPMSILGNVAHGVITHLASRNPTDGLWRNPIRSLWFTLPDRAKEETPSLFTQTLFVWIK